MDVKKDENKKATQIFVCKHNHGIDERQYNEHNSCGKNIIFYGKTSILHYLAIVGQVSTQGLDITHQICVRLNKVKFRDNEYPKTTNQAPH